MIDNRIQIETIYKRFKQHPQVITDSRQAIDGGIFFALKGKNFNGNAYAADALANGADYAVIDDEKYKKEERYILVEDTLKCLQKLARHHRLQFDIPVLAITGSNGKTTTKELVSAVLQQRRKTHWTQGNLNNHIGVPLTLLAMPFDTEIAVIEMGANHRGEIAALSEIAAPTHGLITNIGKAHLEGFEGIEGVKKGKSELYQYLKINNGVAFVNLEEMFLWELSEGIDKRVPYKCSKQHNPPVQSYEFQLLALQPFVKTGFLSENGEQTTVHSKLMGKHNFYNIITAIAVGYYFRVPAEKIIHAIENYIPAGNRSQLIKKTNRTIMLDAYNANPTSMKYAMDAFAKMAGSQKVAILGAMLELGADSKTEHAAILDYALSKAFDKVVCVGGEFEKAAKAAGVPYFSNVRSLSKWYEQQDWEGTSLLLKGSRGIRLEQLLE